MFREILELFHKDNLLKQALDESYIMLDIDRKMFFESVQTLRKKNTAELKIDIMKEDLKINKYERRVRKKVFTHLTISGTTNIATGLVLTSIIIDIERIGDYTKNIAELAINHPPQLNGGTIENELAELEDKVINIFDQLISAFKNSNVETARELMRNSKEITRKCDQWVCSMIKGEITLENSSDAICLALYIRYLKRVCAHLRNIATSIVNPFHRIGYREKTKNDTE